MENTIETLFKPENLSLWTLPSFYAGVVWEDYYVFLEQNRDSDDLAESNFARGLKAIGGETGEEDDGISQVVVVRERHWACGWIEWIAIHKSNETALRIADKISAKLKDYPVINDEDLSEREMNSANQVWKDCYDAVERVKYIRDHRSEFEFGSFADLLGCVRGNFFIGYANELLY